MCTQPQASAWHIVGTQYIVAILSFVILFIFDCAGSSVLCRLFSSCSELGLLFVAMHVLIIVMASLVVKHKF